MSKRNKNRQNVASSQPIADAVSTRVEDLIEEELDSGGRPWLRWGLFLLLGILLLVLLAPTIITKTTLGSYLISKVIPQDAGELTIDSMNVGWFQPLRLEGVQFLDPAGEPLLQVDKIEGDRSIVALARNSSDLGTLVISRPVVNLSLRPDGSNLEDTLAKAMESFESTEPTEEEPTSSGQAVSAHIKLVDAVINAREVDTQAVHQLTGFNAEVQLPKSATTDWIVTAQGALNARPFQLNLNAPIAQGTADWPLGPAGSAKLQADALPLNLLRYVAMRVGQPVEQIQGNCTSNLVANWEPNPQSSQPKLEANGLVRLDGVVLAAKSMLGEDVLRLNSAQFDTKVSLTDNVAVIEQGDLQSDFGNAQLVTAIKLDSFQDTNAIIAAIRRQKLNTQGQIDLAQLTKLLPNTLKIRDDVEVSNGRVSWQVNTDVQPTATRWTGGLRTEGIQVLRGGQPIDWKFPLEMQFAAVDDNQEFVVENVTARSDFFALAGQGRLRQGQLQAQADLERLVFQLGQVVDLGNIYVQGQMQGLVQWQEQQANQVSLDAKTKLTDFQMRQDTQLLCEEKELNTATVATMTINGQQVESLDSARVDIVSGGDYLIAQLQEPVANPNADSNWSVACRLKGEIASWFGRLKTVGIGREWQTTGQVDSTVHLTANPKQATIHNLTADVRNLRAQTDGILVDEPVIQVQSAGAIDLVTMACRFPETTVASQTVSLAAREFSLGMEPHFAASGNLSYRADLGRLMSFFPSDANTPSQQYRGGAVGRVALNSQGDTTTFNLDGAIENLIVIDATGAPLWEEPQLTTKLNGHYDGKQDALELQQAQIAGKVLNLAAQGRATTVSSAPTVDVSGEYGYDLNGIVTIFRSMIGPDVQLTGNQRQRFVAKGPIFPTEANSKALVSNELVAQAGIGWDDAEAYGIRLANAQVDAALQQGVLQTSPLELTVGEQGKLRVVPTVHVNSEPLWLTLQPGPIAENIQLDPEMTGGWMRYVTPLLADATSAEGTFSVALTRAEIPLVEPTAGRVEGELDFHGGALGPGPMASQLLQLATQIKQLTGRGDSRIADPTKSWVQIEPQKITFQMAQNRVYHEGFRMSVDGVSIQTRGSVGIEDQSLAVMAEVPILDEWIEKTPHLAGLRGQVISVPIHGTTTKPELDKRALAQVTMQVAKQGATGYLQNQLNEKLGGKINDALGGKLNDALGGELGGALGQSLGGLLGGQTQPAANAANPQATQGANNLSIPFGGGQNSNPANNQSNSPAQNQGNIGTQLQNRVQDEIGKQLNNLFK